MAMSYSDVIVRGGGGSVASMRIFGLYNWRRGYTRKFSDICKENMAVNIEFGNIKPDCTGNPTSVGPRWRR